MVYWMVWGAEKAALESMNQGTLGGLAGLGWGFSDGVVSGLVFGWVLNKPAVLKKV